MSRDAETQSSSILPRQPEGQSWWLRIGYTGLATLVAGTAVILSSCAILILLWRGAESARHRHDPEFKLWRTIIFGGWASRLVTICSAAIRVAMGLQVGLIAAAMAAVMFETSGARFHDTAVLSIERAVGSSPANILPAFIRQCAPGLSGQLHSAMIAATLVVALASTFTSTILLSDFGTTFISGQNTTKNMAIGFDPNAERILNGASYWKSRPLAYWRFAETRHGEPLSTKGVVDTGDVYRDMLPFLDSGSRTSLEIYSGPAVVTNFRTACTGPTFDKLRLNHSYADAGTVGLYVEGNVEAEIEGIDRIEDGPDKSIPIKCKVHNTWNETRSGIWPVSVCDLPVSNTMYRIEGPKDPISGWPYPFHPVMLFNSSAVLNGITAGYNARPNRPMEVRLPKELLNLTTRREGLWTKGFASNGSEVFSASVCFICQSLPQIYNVTMSGRSISSEPQVEWRRLVDPSSNRKTLQQLGVGAQPQDFESRGILDLEIRPGAVDYASTLRSGTPRGITSADMVLSEVLSECNGKSGWSLRDDSLADAENDRSWFAHAAHASVFQGILQETGDLATAVQALTFRLYQMIYYDWQQNWDLMQPVTIVASTEMLIPTRWTGLAVVIGIIGVHLLLVLLTTMRFAQTTRHSAMGSAWQAITQMVSPHTKEAMEGSGVVRDKEVKEWARSTGRDTTCYGISGPAGGLHSNGMSTSGG
ncbi:hypothetical protein ACHAPT_012528 [Fusarium lateritium]